MHVVVKKFMFAISSPDEFLVTQVTTAVRTAGTACRRTAGRSGPAVALHQSPGVVFLHSGHRLRFAVCPDVQVKAVGTVQKQQHIVDRVPAIGLLCVSGVRYIAQLREHRRCGSVFD